MKKLSTFLTLLFLVGTLPLLSGCGKSGQSAKPLGPAESMQVMIDGVSNQQLETFWEFLPTSYQNQFNEQAHELAAKMDPELYDGIFKSGQRLTKLLKDKKEFILKNQTIKGLPVPPEKVEEFWEPTVNILSAIVNGESSSLEKLKKFDGKKLFSNEGNVVLKNVFKISELIPSKEGTLNFSEKMKQTKVTLISTEGNTAMVKIEAPGEKPKELAMVLVEEKWIPKNLAESWKPRMDEIRKQIAEITPEKIAAQKKQLMPALQKFNEQVALLENAKTEEEFNKTLTPIVAPVAMFAPMLMMQMGPMMGAPQGQQASPMPLGGPQSLGASNAADPETVVTIVIDKKLSNAEQDPIIDELIKVVDGANILPTVEGETTIIRVSPVKNVDEFAKKIKFGKTTKVDPKTRSITVELAK